MGAETNKLFKPRFSTVRKDFRFRVDKAEIIPLGNEYYVSVNIEGRRYEGVVPTSTVDLHQTPPVVEGTIVGQLGDDMLISLAPSSMGAATWTMSNDDVKKIEIAR